MDCSLKTPLRRSKSTVTQRQAICLGVTSLSSRWLTISGTSSAAVANSVPSFTAPALRMP